MKPSLLRRIAARVDEARWALRTGIKGLLMLPSVLNGLRKVMSAMGDIKSDVPVIVDTSKTMTVALQGAV